jgi:hypothetical protein
MVDEPLKTSASQRRASKKYYEKHKDEPEFKAKRIRNTMNWITRNRDRHNVTALASYYTKRLADMKEG